MLPKKEFSVRIFKAETNKLGQPKRREARPEREDLGSTPPEYASPTDNAAEMIQFLP